MTGNNEKKIPKALRAVFRAVQAELDPRVALERAFADWMEHNPERLAELLTTPGLDARTFNHSSAFESWFRAPHALQQKVARTLDRATNSPTGQARFSHGRRVYVVKWDNNEATVTDTAGEPAPYVPRAPRVPKPRKPYSQMTRQDFARERDRDDRRALAGRATSARQQRSADLQQQRRRCRANALAARVGNKGPAQRVAIARAHESCATGLRTIEESYAAQLQELEAQRPAPRRAEPRRGKERTEERDDAVRSELERRGLVHLVPVWDRKKASPKLRRLKADRAIEQFLEGVDENYQDVEVEQERQAAKGDQLAARLACEESKARAEEGDQLALEYNREHCDGATPRPRRATPAERTVTLFGLTNPGTLQSRPFKRWQKLRDELAKKPRRTEKQRERAARLEAEIAKAFEALNPEQRAAAQELVEPIESKVLLERGADVKVRHPHNVSVATIASLLDGLPAETPLSEVTGALTKIGGSWAPWEDGKPGHSGLWKEGARTGRPREVQQELGASGSFTPILERGGAQRTLDEIPAARSGHSAREAETDEEDVEPDDDEELESDPDENTGATTSDPARNPYELKRAKRAARLRVRADAVQAASSDAYGQARARAARIPFGQPIHVGHHSERRDRNFREKIHKGYGKAFKLQAKAEELRRRADFAESGRAISSDDPDAIKKLEAKVEEKRRYLLQAKRINEVIRAARTKRKTGWEPVARERLAQMGIAADEIEGYLRKDFAGRYGVPGFALRNATAEIARINWRIDDLKRRDARPVRAAEKIGEATLSEDRELNRVQIRFDGVPSKEVRSALRGAGFVWAPSTGAWQRKLTESATLRARRLLRELHPAPKEAAPGSQSAAREPGEDGAVDQPLSEAGSDGVPF